LAFIARNVESDGGEIDLLMSDGGTRVVVEVRTITTGGDPVDAVGLEKRRVVRRLAGRLGAGRVDFLGVSFQNWGAEVHWVPG
jgi:Holliday junction resolvase-like predicted endonuclease